MYNAKAKSEPEPGCACQLLEKCSLLKEAFASAEWEESFKKDDIFLVPGILCKAVCATEGMRVKRMFLLRGKDVLQRTKEGLLRRKQPALDKAL